MTHSRVTKYNAIHIRGTWGQKGHQQKTQHYALLKKSVEKYIYIKIIIHWWLICIFTAVYCLSLSLVDRTVNNHLSEKYFLRVHGMTEGNHHSTVKGLAFGPTPFQAYMQRAYFIYIYIHKQGFEQMQLFNVTIFCGVLTSNPVIYGTCIYIRDFIFPRLRWFNPIYQDLQHLPITLSWTEW